MQQREGAEGGDGQNRNAAGEGKRLRRHLRPRRHIEVHQQVVRIDGEDEHRGRRPARQEHAVGFPRAVGVERQDLVDGDHPHIDRHVDEGVAEEIDQVLGQQGVEGDFGEIQVGDADRQHGGAADHADDVGDGGHGAGDHRLWRGVGRVALEQQRPAQAARQAAVARDDGAGAFQMQQQEAGADYQHAAQKHRGGAHFPLAAGNGRQGIEEGPAGAELADDDGAQNHHRADQEADEVDGEDGRTHPHVARQKVPHDAGAGHGAGADQGGRVHGHQLIEDVRVDGQPPRVGQPHQQADQHHQQEHAAGDGHVAEHEAPGQGRYFEIFISCHDDAPAYRTTLISETIS